MNHHAKRPTPVPYVATSVICTVGLIAVGLRILHTCTPFTLVEPFDTITFIVGVTYAIVGPIPVAWLATTALRRDNAIRRAELAELSAEHHTFDSQAEDRLKRHITGELERLADHLAERVAKTIRDTPPSVAYLPRTSRQDGQQYRTVAVGGQGDNAPLPIGLDEESIAAARRITQRLRGVDNI